MTTSVIIIKTNLISFYVIKLLNKIETFLPVRNYIWNLFEINMDEVNS